MTVIVNGREYDGDLSTGWSRTGRKLHLSHHMWTDEPTAVCGAPLLPGKAVLHYAVEVGVDVCRRCFPKGDR